MREEEKDWLYTAMYLQGHEQFTQRFFFYISHRVLSHPEPNVEKSV